MTPHAHLDFETRGTADLKTVGTWNYVSHFHTDVWCASYAIGEEEPRLWLPGQPEPEDLLTHISNGGRVYAHNAPFELAVWNTILTSRYGWPTLPVEQTFCTMAQCLAMGLPAGLEDAALALGLSILKDRSGRALMLRLARPRRAVKPGEDPVWWTDEDKLQRLYEYCRQDVRVERELSARTIPLSRAERAVWLLDFKINQRGVAVDMETAMAGADAAVSLKEKAGRDLMGITGGAVESVSALNALKEWMGERGVPAPSLDKDAVESLLATEIPPDVRSALVCRSESNKASLAKLDRIVSLAGTDNRLRNWSQYHGASTGRFAARGVQTHNLVRDMPPAEVVEDVMKSVRDGALDWVDLAYGPPMDMLSKCLRSFFVAPPGSLLSVGDWNAVEGRGTAWVSKEDWKLDVFRAYDAGRGAGAYEQSASRMFDIPVEQIDKDSQYRFIGKVSELAFGYQGGVGAARRFLPNHLSSQFSNGELNRWKLAWRAAHPNVVKMWYSLQRAAIEAVQSPGEITTAGPFQFRVNGSFLWCRLPSNRVMCYPYPKLLSGSRGPILTYMTVPSANDIKRGQIIKDVMNSNTWARVGTYGGALMENVVQAICRDILVDAMLELDARGVQIVMHIHDEIVAEAPQDEAPEVKRIMDGVMSASPAWGLDFPLKADAHLLERYRK